MHRWTDDREIGILIGRLMVASIGHFVFVWSCVIRLSDARDQKLKLQKMIREKEEEIGMLQ